MKYNLIRTALLIIVLQYANISWSQSKIYIRCQKTNEPIPYASLSWNNGKMGLIANDNGEIILESVPQEFLVSALGYKDSIYIIGEDKLGKSVLFLAPTGLTLPEVTIKPSKTKKRTIALKSKNKSSLASYTDYKFAIGSSIKVEKTSEIRGVKFFIERVGSIHPHKIRLRILKLDEEMYPSYDILNEFVELKPHKKGWVYLDLEKFSLIIESGYYLFALEWLIIDEFKKSEIWQVYNEAKDVISLRTYISNLSYDPNIWHKKDDYPWKLMSDGININSFAPWMKVELLEYQ